MRRSKRLKRQYTDESKVEATRLAESVGGHEAPRQQVVRDGQRVAAVGGVDELAPPQGPQSVLAHQTPHSVTPDVQPLSA